MKKKILFVIWIFACCPGALFAADGIPAFAMYGLLGILVNLLILGLFAYFFFWRRRSEQLKTEMLLSALPIHIGVVNEKEKVLFMQAGCRNHDVKTTAPAYLRDLPVELYRELAPAVQEVFRTRENIVREYGAFGCHWQIEFQLVSAAFFGEDAVMWMSSDVTNLREAYTATERLAKRFRLILESIGDAVIVTDGDGRISQINPVACSLLNCGEKNAVGEKPDKFFSLISPGNTEKNGLENFSPLAQVLRTGQGCILPSRTELRTVSGKVRRIMANIAPLFEDDGAIAGAVLFFRDVTEDNKKRDLLNAQNAILRSATSMADIVYFKCDSNANITPFGNVESFWRLYQGVPVPPVRWMEKSDARKFREERRKFLKSKEDSFHFTYRSAPENGGKHFEMRVLKTLEESENGDADREIVYYGIVQDITAHHANECLYRDNAALLQSIMDNLPGCIFVKDADDNFRYILSNRAFDRFISAEGASSIGKTDSELISDASVIDKIHYSDYTVLRENKLMETETTLRASDGEKHTMRTLKTMLKQSGGHRFLLGMSIDITRQEQLEEERSCMIEKLNSHICGERVLNQCLSGILAESDLYKAVTGMLHTLGENAGADHCYILEADADGFGMRHKISEWFSPGSAVYLQRPDSSDWCSDEVWNKKLSAHEDILAEDLGDPRSNAEIPEHLLKKSSLKSVYVGGIWNGNVLCGCIGMDFASSKRSFSENDIHLFHSGIKFYQLALEREKRREAVADSMALQREIVENIAIPIAIFDHAGSIVSANSGISDICGEAAEELIGKKYYDVLCDSMQPSPECPIAATLIDRKSHSTERRMRDRDLILSSQPLLDRSRNMKNVLFYSIDVTELTLQKKRIQEAMELALTADRAKNNFIAAMSHEVRTPLNALVGFSELLQQGSLSEKERMNYLTSIRHASQTLLTLINDVLDLSKLETNTIAIRETPTNLHELFSEVLRGFDFSPGEQKAELRPNPEKPVPVFMFDQQRLIQILVNLISSMLKNAPGRTIEIIPEFESSGDGSEGVLRFTIHFKPVPGASMAEQPVSGENARNIPSLEFTLVKRLVSCMEGELDASSGAEEYQIVFRNVHTAAPEKALPSGAETLFEKSRPASVLIVDDIPLNLTVLGALFKKLSIPFRTCSSASEALKEASAEKPGVVFTDLWMPEMNGDELARKLKENPATSDVLVAAITADAQLEQSVMESFDCILIKPITLNILKDRIGKNFPFLLPK